MNEQGSRWMRLDNAAKIYPAAKRRNWSNVFRLSATLSEQVDIDLLSAALERVVKRFPSIAVGLRRGLFWYYLEEIEVPPPVRPDGPFPNSRMTMRDIRKCAFRVLCYQNRVAVEFFHALTDGNGGLVFLKTLLAEYLTRRYPIEIPATDGVLDRTEDPQPEELEDSFLKYGGDVSASRREPDSYRLRGTPERDGFLHITTGILDVNEALAAAKKRGVSMTTFLASALLVSIAEIQAEELPRRRRKPVKVLIPVNLRKLFDSRTLRNFVLYITPGITPRMGDYTFEETLKSVHHQMGMELTDKQMGSRITANVRAEQSLLLKIMPLFVKNLAMKMAFNLVGEKKSCLSFSNLGAVTLPESMHPYVTRMDFVLGAQATRPNNCGVLSYGGKLYISFIRNIREPTLEHRFFTFLVKNGLHVTIESNQKEEGI